jgi:hypothetical protein
MATPAKSNRDRRAVQIERLDPKLVEVYRSWSPEKRMKVGSDQMLFVRAFLRSAVTDKHPDWNEDEIQREIARRIGGYSR